MRRVIALAGVMLMAAPMVAQTAAAPAQQSAMATGLVQSYSQGVLTLKEQDGTVVSGTIAPNALLQLYARRKLSDIKPGDFIASGGTRGADGKIRANEIRILPGVRGEGQFPMAQPNQVMTNATVEAVMTNATVKSVDGAGGAPLIKLTFHGASDAGAAKCTGRAADAPGGTGTGCVGETEFEVPANVRVVAALPGNVSMLKPEVQVMVTAVQGADGSVSFTRVTISEL